MEPLDNQFVHIAELATMALIKDDHHMLVVYRMFLLGFAELVEFLNSRNDDAVFVLAQLLMQHSRGFIMADAAFLELLVLLHRLVVQVLAVHHKQHFVHILQLGT